MCTHRQCGKKLFERVQVFTRANSSCLSENEEMCYQHFQGRILSRLGSYRKRHEPKVKVLNILERV